MSLKSLAIISLLIESCLTFIFLINVLNLRINIFKTFCILMASIISTSIITYPLKEFLIVKPIAMAIVLYICLRKISKNSSKEIIIILSATIGFILVTDFFAHYIYGIFTNFDYTNSLELSVPRIIAILFGYIVYFTLTMGFSLFWNKIVNSIKKIFILILILVPTSQFTLLLGMYLYNYDNLTEKLLQYGIACVVILIAVDTLLYLSIKEYSKLTKKEKEREFEKMKQGMEFSYYKLANKNKEYISKLKHDIRNQLQTAYFLLNNSNNNIDSQNIVDNISHRLESLDNIYYCENSIVNTIISLKTTEAKKYKIPTKISLRDIDKLVINELDLCSIFSNLYDNAINCCIKNKYKENNFISIISSKEAGYIVIKFLNWCDLDIVFNKKNTILTTNKDSKNHGYGLKILNDITNRYDGNLSMKHENNIFSITLLLKIE